MNKDSKGIKIFGVILIVIGVIIVLNQFDVLEYFGIYHFSIWSFIGHGLEAIFDLWPAFIIAAGFALIFKGSTARKLIVLLLIVSIVGYMILGPMLGFAHFGYRNGSMKVENFDDRWDDDFGEAQMKVKNEMVEPTEERILLDQSINLGDVEMDIRGCTLYMSSHEQDSAVFTYNWLRPNMQIQIENNRMNIDIEDDSASKGKEKRASLVLSQRIPWEISLDAGASTSNLDLADLEVRELDIDAGAGMLEIYLGSKGTNTHVNIDGGVSAINLNVMQDSGIKIYSNGGLSGNNFTQMGLQEVGNNTYQSDNYQDAAHKINVEIDLGVGDIHLVRF